MARIAIIAYYFPPGGEIGGLRPSSLARDLAAMGHDVVVVTHQSAPAERGFSAISVGAARPDASGGAQRRPNRRPPVTWPREIARRLFAIPDGKTRWALQAAAAVRTSAAEHPFDAIVTTGPPHSVHLAGMWSVRRSQGRRPRWIVDMRDLWTDNPYYDYGSLRRRFDGLIESRVMRRADAVTASTTGFARSLETRHGINAEGILTGYDDSAAAPPARRTGARPFRVVHAGNLYAGRRDPGPILEAVRALAADGLVGPGDLMLTFIGPETALVADVAAALGVADLVEVVPEMPHPQVLEYLERADALLLVQWSSDLTATEVPGKLYEYLAYRKPVIALGTAPDGEAAAIIRGTGGGRVVNSVEECREALTDALEGRLSGPEESLLAAYSQSRMAAEFARFATGDGVVAR